MIEFESFSSEKNYYFLFFFFFKYKNDYVVLLKCIHFLNNLFDLFELGRILVSFWEYISMSFISN